ncbi:hypothetical protein ACFYVR_15920 [Rhodococcus sp. NPDC003318]|uniref:hypothetical protein n=1 Tax=Rhodococcus sp. NPDC003318 TaxID=3364503 RepID=UPI003680F2B9
MIVHKTTTGLRRPSPFDRGGNVGDWVAAVSPVLHPTPTLSESGWRKLLHLMGFALPEETQADYTLAGPKEAP